MTTTQYLSFTLAGEEYAIDILKVQEIRGLCPVTPLPQSPPTVRGVMNLRGAVVPVVELRSALGLYGGGDSPLSVIIVLSVRGRTMGFVVDSVSDVLSVEATSVERTPEIAGRVDSGVVQGIARVNERFVMLVDIDRVAGVEAEAAA